MLESELTAGILTVLALNLYVLLGGADYGGGVWDLLASGPRAQRQRDTIAHAIGPIWEANHVWLIVVVVVLFIAFPPAFAAIATALHVPLTLALLGIVLRGSAFTFRTYEFNRDLAQRRWGRMFAIASLITPVLLGVTVGALSSGRIRFLGTYFAAGFFETWLTRYSFLVGFFALALFAFLAAVYLTLEARDDPELQDDFRKRALAAAVATGVMALAVFLAAGEDAPLIRRGLLNRPWSWPLVLATTVSATGAAWALWSRRFQLARVLAAAQVTLILWGWALAQYPYLVAPDFTLANSKAPAVSLRLLALALLAGSLILMPALYYLFRVFKGEQFARRSGPRGA